MEVDKANKSIYQARAEHGFTLARYHWRCIVVDTVVPVVLNVPAEDGAGELTNLQGLGWRCHESNQDTPKFRSGFQLKKCRFCSAPDLYGRNKEGREKKIALVRQQGTWVWVE